jgi:hypothetical protein
MDVLDSPDVNRTIVRLSTPTLHNHNYRHFLRLTARALIFLSSIFGLAVWFGYLQFSPLQYDLHYNVRQYAMHIKPIDASDAAFGVVSTHKFFLAANLKNNEKILINHLTEMVKFILYVGPERCYVSILENGSKDRTPDILRDFKAILEELKVRHSIISLDQPDMRDPELPRLEEWGNAFAKELSKEAGLNLSTLKEWDAAVKDGLKYPKFGYLLPRRRIEYMAKLRNMALKPLYKFAQTPADASKTLVVFLNDVIYTYKQLTELLGTSVFRADEPEELNQKYPGQLDYDAVCSLDLMGVKLYDAWVLRDMNGRIVSAFYPYFSEEVSRERIRQGQPVRVFSCWNGLIVIKAEVFVKVGFSLSFS